LTLDRAVRLLEAALEEPELRLPRAIYLVEYTVADPVLPSVRYDG
jgi:hypothetical protein